MERGVVRECIKKYRDGQGGKVRFGGGTKRIVGPATDKGDPRGGSLEGVSRVTLLSHAGTRGHQGRGVAMVETTSTHVVHWVARQHTSELPRGG
jgi:hypothetical protein